MCQGSKSLKPLICDEEEDGTREATKIKNIISTINQQLPDHMNKSSKKQATRV